MIVAQTYGTRSEQRSLIADEQPISHFSEITLTVSLDELHTIGQSLLLASAMTTNQHLALRAKDMHEAVLKHLKAKKL